MAVEASESWVRERVDLNYENLGDVRSLSLPGSYHEKINYLGTALHSFERLKNLDLSRNSLISLDGLDHLTMLETLNLYYNNISSLKDLFQLRHNSNLQELDLRLNPVTKNEPDYRLFVVHMLPNLRKLDDRSVRDSERKAALLHFNSEQANELTEHAQEEKAVMKGQRLYQPRAEYVRGMAKRTSVVEDDDSELLDMIARTGGDLRRPRVLSGSAVAAPSVEHHERDHSAGVKISQETDVEPVETHPSLSRYDEYSTHPSPSRRANLVTQMRDMHDVDGDPQDREVAYSGYGETGHRNQAPGFDDAYLYSKLPVVGHTQQTIRPHSPTRGRTRVQFQDGVRPRGTELGDPNLRFTDETDAYSSYKSVGYFTPNPKTDSSHLGISGSRATTNQIKTTQEGYTSESAMATPQRRPTESRQLTGQSETYYKPAPASSCESKEMPAQVTSLSSDKDGSVDPVSEEFLTKFLNLVDRYWNGSKSLHKHKKFQGQARTMLSNFVSDVTAESQQKADLYQKDLAKFAQENVSLRGQLTTSAKESSQNQMNHEGLQTALQLAQDDMDVLKEKLHQAKEENQALKEQVSSMETGMPKIQTAVKSSELQTKHISVLEDENETLQREIDKMRLQLKHYAQLQELANMLQESHKSLVTTNDHLLQELNETKDRHSNEVKQLHWSYSELKRTMDIMPKYTSSQGLSSGSFTSDVNSQRRYNGDT
ncbi:centrosomal protein of 72 kDa-like isoform X2 [Anneissia japonica]|uniref:centrosomal protein of 72 kDa-like isoform X2 n=1 Tax=Anneissia japonica TaxID=1529436 RepID=UPI0014256579|nr:centrosomal protein of 72 kDa-like isoform X2 [Anneissia japonica]